MNRRNQNIIFILYAFRLCARLSGMIFSSRVTRRRFRGERMRWFWWDQCSWLLAFLLLEKRFWESLCRKEFSNLVLTWNGFNKFDRKYFNKVLVSLFFIKPLLLVKKSCPKWVKASSKLKINEKLGKDHVGDCSEDKIKVQSCHVSLRHIFFFTQ